jgi:hypothetical protein
MVNKPMYPHTIGIIEIVLNNLLGKNVEAA